MQRPIPVLHFVCELSDTIFESERDGYAHRPIGAYNWRRARRRRHGERMDDKPVIRHRSGGRHGLAAMPTAEFCWFINSFGGYHAIVTLQTRILID